MHFRKEVKPQQERSAAQPAEEQLAAPTNAEVQTPDVVSLQRYVGNQGVQRMLAEGQMSPTGSTLIQAKLAVGPADDAYEQEADRVAHEVVHGGQGETAQRAGEEDELTMKRADVQRAGEEDELTMKRADVQRAGEEDEMNLKRADVQRAGEEDELTMKRADVQRAGEEDELTMKRADVQRAGEEDELTMKRADVQRKGTEAGFEVGGEVEQQILSAKGSGDSLPDTQRQQMESGFGADFSGVKVHTDAQSDALNQSLDARAFTTGQDIFFRAGEYNPGSSSGQELLAHELTHVVQQGGASVQAKPDDAQA